MAKETIGKRVGRYLKHILLTVVVLTVGALIFFYYNGNHYIYGKDTSARILNNEGPHIFYQDSTISVNYIKGDQEEGYTLSSKTYPKDELLSTTCYYPLDGSKFTFNVLPELKTPATVYNDNEDIFVVSDIESNYATLRDLLISSKVIDDKLNWTFGKGHLVLNGDFLDRSFFSTQVFYFIMKLEQNAALKGGMVHFILGNHEIMNMQGLNHYSRSKYMKTAAVLDVMENEIYGSNSYLGKWLESKNTMEMINGHLFVHAGIDPDLADLNLNIDQMNEIIRKNYFKKYYPRKGAPKYEALLLSSKTSPYWFRGYFMEDMPMEDIQKGLDFFGAKDVVVGHTVQKEVQKLYDGKVIGVDVKHPKDYCKYFPALVAEGLLIQGDKYYRVDATGVKEEI